MLAYRTTWIIREGRMQEALEAISAALDAVNMEEVEGGLAARVYTPYISPNMLIYEEIWEDVASHDAYWEAMDQTTPEAAPFWTEWAEVTERNVGTDCWNVAEWRLG
jgi:quinol monooxygenase YgiN